MNEEQDSEPIDIIEGKLERLKSRDAYNHLLNYPNYAVEQKIRNREVILKLVDPVENSLPKIKEIITYLKSKLGPLSDQDKWTATYLLLGKAFSNLETIILLAKDGRNLEMMDIARSAQESMDLIFLFLEDEDSTLLNKWLKGDIIPNQKARDMFHKIINKEREKVLGEEVILPIDKLKSHMYWLYSQYTHSGYGAILDSVDVFHEDLDFDRVAGFHWSRRNFHIVRNIVLTLAIQFKGIFLKRKDREGFIQADKFYKSLGFVEATKEEIDAVIKKYSSK